MPIPYLGSKSKGAAQIYEAIATANAKGTLVDLLCGGFAISEYFLQRGWNVIANDKNQYVIALLRKVLFEGLDEKIVTRFVSRGHFTEVLKTPDNYEAWYVGYIMCIWSFGNNQKDYLFGKNVEPYKLAGHELVINQNPVKLLTLMPKLSENDLRNLASYPTWQIRRAAYTNYFNTGNVLWTLEFQRLQQLQQLENLERLQQLQQLERLERLQLFCDDYRNVQIPEGAIVYCDPPYRDKAEYVIDGFNHEEFWDYIRQLSKTHIVYVSEYQAPPDFKVVLEYQQRSTYSATSNTTQTDEKVFIHESNYYPLTLFDLIEAQEKGSKGQY